MSTRQPGGEAPKGKSARSPAGDAADNRGPRLNLGCGTLVVLFLLIATAGKFLPHQGRDTPVSAKPERLPPAKPVKRIQPLAEPPAPKSVVKPAPAPGTPAIESKKPESRQPPANPATLAPAPVPKASGKAWPDVLSGLLTEVEKRVKPEPKAPSREPAKSPTARAISSGLEGEPAQSAKSKPGVATPKPRASAATAEPTRSEREPGQKPRRTGDPRLGTGRWPQARCRQAQGHQQPLGSIGRASQTVPKTPHSRRRLARSPAMGQGQGHRARLRSPLQVPLEKRSGPVRHPGSAVCPRCGRRGDRRARLREDT